MRTEMPDVEGNLGVPLQSCCTQALAQIKAALKEGGVLQGMVANSGLFLLIPTPGLKFTGMLGGPILRGAAENADSLANVVNVPTTDWSIFAQAARSAGDMTRARCWQIAEEERYRHQSPAGTKLAIFWDTLSEKCRPADMPMPE